MLSRSINFLSVLAVILILRSLVTISFLCVQNLQFLGASWNGSSASPFLTARCKAARHGEHQETFCTADLACLRTRYCKSENPLLNPKRAWMIDLLPPILRWIAIHKIIKLTVHKGMVPASEFPQETWRWHSRTGIFLVCCWHWGFWKGCRGRQPPTRWDTWCSLSMTGDSSHAPANAAPSSLMARPKEVLTFYHSLSPHNLCRTYGLTTWSVQTIMQGKASFDGAARVSC